ncbi:Nuclear GTPase SLIP-GC 3 [Colletotrichum chrysophilum]|uniref:Nuclear GTPase SLIP-GC 3 n=2 Tax=Colletotrichum chrysophilum TaxID=1836956 RepID=A0AAD9AMW6_9PEZI|nr:Nuclear GTPase SLIP-GC 3 [Colletotrichum chrysophilum]
MKVAEYYHSEEDPAAGSAATQSSSTSSANFTPRTFSPASLDPEDEEGNSSPGPTNSDHSSASSSDTERNLSPTPARDGMFIFRGSTPSNQHRKTPDTTRGPSFSPAGRPQSRAIALDSASRSSTSHTRTPSVSSVTPSTVSTDGGHIHGQPSSSRASRTRSTAEIEAIGPLLNELTLDGGSGELGMAELQQALPSVSVTTENQEPEATSPVLGLRQTSLSPRPPRRSRRVSRTNQAPHDVKDEELPHDRFHHPDVQSAFLEAKTLMSRLARVLGSSPLHVDPDSAIKRLHKRAKDLSRFQCPPTRTVGFVGDSGVGKSSLLNSLLHQEGLARTSNSGAACTCVVTEYHYDMRDDFQVDVELFTQDDLMEQVTHLLQSYRRFHLHAEEMTVADGLEEAKEHAGVARDTFRALFRGRLGNEAFLTTEPEGFVLWTFRRWLEDGVPELGGIHNRSSKESCSDFLIQLTSEAPGSQGPAIWPFVRKIKVFLDAHILSKGLVLVDLPGLRDLNSARRSITERYLLECDEVFALCNIGRATTDVGVASVFELVRRAGLSKVGIVCTRSDDIQASEAKNDWKGQRAKRIQQLSAEVATARGQIDGIKRLLDEYDDEDLTKEEEDEMYDLHRDLRKEEKIWEQKLHDLKTFLVETRNAEVRKKLQASYRDKVRGGIVHVFCISNTEYWSKATSPKDEAIPSLQLSGIIALRKHCLSIIADSQLRLATKFVTNDIPALLGEAGLWVESGAGSANAEQKSAVRRTLDKIERQLREWAHQTYSAFCRNYGNYCTPAIGPHDWNQDIITKMARDLTPQWKQMLSSIQGRLNTDVENLEDEMDAAMELLSTELEAFPEVNDVIGEILLARTNQILSRMESLRETFQDDVRALEVDALTGIRTSIVGKAMEESYRRCNMEYGRGSDQRRKGIINGTVQSQDFFMNHMREFRRRWKTLADEFQKELQDSIKDELSLMSTSFDIIRDENVAMESEENPELRQCLEIEIGRAKEQLERIRDIISSQ